MAAPRGLAGRGTPLACAAGMVVTLAAGVAAALALLDANGDGFVKPHEAWADARVERRFPLGDLNHDGRLDAEELSVLLTAQHPAAGPRSRT